MRRFVCGVLAVCLLAGFCACGRGEVGEVEEAIREYMSAQSATTEASTTEVITTEAPPATTFSAEVEQAIALFKEEWGTPEEEIVPFHRVETRHIHKNMREYEFTLYGFHRDSDRDTFADTIYAIDIKEPDGKFHQRLDGFTTYLDNFAPEDFNNDGYLDIRLHACLGGSMRNEPSLFWLWDNTKQKFVRNKQLEEISQDWGISVKDDGRIRCYTRAGAWGYGLLYFSYINGVFVEVEKVDVYPKDWNYIADAVFVRDTYKRINGEMKLVSTEELEDWTQ